MGNVTDGGSPGPQAKDFADIREWTVEDLEGLIADAPEGNEREALKAAIREAEYAADGDPRKGIVDATEPLPVTPPPPADEPATSPVADDTPIRPELTAVAEARAANRNVRDRSRGTRED